MSHPRRSPAVLGRELAQGKSVLDLAVESGVSRKHLERVAKERGEQLPLFDGVRRTLCLLWERGASIGVVTNLTGSLVRPLVEATDIRRYFSTVVTPGRGVPRKPSPRGILKALKQMEREADRHTWLVGDECTDGEAAKAAGVRFAWASYGYSPTILAADVELGRFADVLEL